MCPKCPTIWFKKRYLKEGEEEGRRERGEGKKGRRQEKGRKEKGEGRGE